jgi:haloalkane dehalogenase
MDQSARSLFERLRSPEGEELVLKDNVFIEKILPSPNPAVPCRN